MAAIKLEIRRCMPDCPYCISSLTKGYGYATDYRCSKMGGTLICGYVEWDSDKVDVPDWCPLLIKDEN